MNAPPSAPRAPAVGTCPICGRPTVAEVKPFCSKRCADVDLSRWLGGVYRIEGPEKPNPAANEADPEAE